MVIHAYNPSTQETKAGGSHVPGQLEICRESLSQKIKTKKIK
jgi:hypothetical protein